MTGVAVNVTLVPEQMVVPGFAVMVTLTGRFGFTVVVIVFEVAGFPVGQVTLDVRTQYTASPVVRPVVAYVAAPVPTGVPPSYH